MSYGWWERHLCLCGREFNDCRREQGLACETSGAELREKAEAIAPGHVWETRPDGVQTLRKLDS